MPPILSCSLPLGGITFHDALLVMFTVYTLTRREETAQILCNTEVQDGKVDRQNCLGENEKLTIRVGTLSELRTLGSLRIWIEGLLIPKKL